MGLGCHLSCVPPRVLRAHCAGGACALAAPQGVRPWAKGLLCGMRARDAEQRGPEADSASSQPVTAQLRAPCPHTADTPGDTRHVGGAGMEGRGCVSKLSEAVTIPEPNEATIFQKQTGACSLRSRRWWGYCPWSSR